MWCDEKLNPAPKDVFYSCKKLVSPLNDICIENAAINLPGPGWVSDEESCNHISNAIVGLK